MIIGKISESSQKKLLLNNKNIKIIFDYLENTISSDLKTNRIEITNDIFAYNLKYKTRRFTEDSWEAHKKYLDFHLILEGEEKVIITNVENIKVTREYDDKNDVLLGKSTERQTEITLRKGMYAIIFPEEAHAAGIYIDNPKDVHKLVFKIQVNKLYTV